MEMPGRDVALVWLGRTVIDRDGAEIGACTAVFADDATEVAEWVCAELDGATVVIPAVGAAESGERLQVAVSRADAAAAPSVSGDQHISTDEEAALYRHYGIPHSREASPTVLPTGEVGDAEPRPDDAAAATAEPAGTPAPADPVGPGTQPAAESLPSDGAAEPVPAPPVLPPGRPERVPEAGTEFDLPAPDRGTRRPLLLAGGLAGLVAAGTALRRRRLHRRRPSTRAERLAERGRAASATLSARAARLAASAAPALESTGEVVRRRGKPGAAAGAAAALAAALAAIRRRRSRDTDRD